MDTVIVCLPVFNEVKAISKMIDDIRSEGFDLVITDGGSTDGSLEIAAEKGVKILHRPGKSKAFGMKQAMQYAYEIGKSHICYIDCDMTYPADRIRDIAKYRYEYDLILGTRNYNKISVFSRMLNQLLNVIINLLFGSRFKDVGTGMRMLRIEKFLDLLTIDGIDLEIEICGIASRKKYKIKEVEVDYMPRIGESKITFYDMVKVLFTIIKVWRGKY